jgi:putative glycosyltransferase (TIGR04372 family)
MDTGPIILSTLETSLHLKHVKCNQMNFWEKLSNILSKIKEEGLGPFFMSRIQYRSFQLFRKARYQLVGLLYGNVFHHDPVKLCQLEYFCEEISSQTRLSKDSLIEKEVNSLLKKAYSYLSSNSFDKSIFLLEKIKDLDPNNPDLPSIYFEYSTTAFLEIGAFKSIAFKSELAGIKLQKLQTSKLCFQPFNGLAEVLNSEWTAAIGHMGLTANFIQAKQLDLLPSTNYVVIVGKSANNCYLSYLSSFKGFKFILEKDYKYFYSHCFHPISKSVAVWEMKDGYKDLYSSLNTIAEKSKLERLPPLLTIKKEDKNKGLGCLRELDIPPKAWFVSLHARDGFSGDGNLRDGRNVDIDSYIPAIKAITSAGGYVFRMGDSSMKPLPELPNVIDYALSEYKSDWMDVFLWASCRFFIGTVSGPAEIPPTFGVPVLLTNTSVFGLLSFQRHNSFMIPKLWYSKAKERLLTFSEILASPGGWCERRTIGDDLTLIDNSTDEIEAGVNEMISLTKEGVQRRQYDIVKDPLNPLQIKLNAIRERYNARGQATCISVFS